MARAEALNPGRTAFARREWGEAFAQLAAADRESPLEVRPTILRQATPLIRVKPADLTAAGVARVPRVVGTRDGRPLLADDRTLDVANVIWCTGFHPGFSWIRLPVFDGDGEPRHERGIAAEPGLYFVGLEFLYSATSATITGVGRDAERVARAIESRTRTARAAA